MKKLLILIVSILCLFLINTNDVKSADGPNGKPTPDVAYKDVDSYSASYYSSVTGKKSDALLEALASLSLKNHKTYTDYDDLWGAACYADVDPNNSNNIIDFYTQVSMPNTYNTDKWNREHVWCQNNANGTFTTSGAGADIHHIRPTTKSINSSRGDSLYGEAANKKAKYYSFSKNKITDDPSDTLYGYLDGCFEPIDTVKGDVARIIMYMYMHYSKEVSANSSHNKAGNLVITKIIYTPTGTKAAAFDLLVKWNNMDPVDDKEETRNDYAASVTGLRNPFIDHPEFATMIWDGSYSGAGALKDNNVSNTDYQDLLNEYQNSGVYTKKTNIFLNAKSSNELAQYFHGEVAKDRTTYYNGEYLLMANLDGSIGSVDSKNNVVSGINSGYRTAGNDVKHFVYKDGNVVDTYTVKGTTLHNMYVTLNKMKTNYLNSNWVDGIYEVRDKNDSYLADFLAFTAPCLTDYVLSSNYLTAAGMKLEISEEKNSISSYLALRIYVSSVDKGKVGADGILSEARIYKGNSIFNDTNLSSTPVVPEGGSSGGNNSGSSSGSSTTPSTPQKVTYSYTFTSKVYKTYDSLQTLGDRNWKATGTNISYFGYNSEKGQQFGSASDPCYSLNLTVTTSFNNISSIYITTSGAKDTQAVLRIYVGSTLYGERNITSTSSTYRVYPGGASGRVSFKYTQSTKEGVAKAIYIKEIKVYYTDNTTKVLNNDLGLFDNSIDITNINSLYEINENNDLITMYPSINEIYF